MQIGGKHRRTIGLSQDGNSVWIIDQTKLPFAVELVDLKSCEDAARAIKEMWVRGAPLIGATAAYGLFLAMLEDSSDAHLQACCDRLMATRPTAYNLRWAIDRVRAKLSACPPSDRVDCARNDAAAICDEDVEICRKIGEFGLKILKDLARNNGGRRLELLTHCNAGWLATIDWGTATAPIYRAQQEGIDLHVWVGETRPRNQGASLTAFELLEQGVPHTLIVDNAGGHLMQHDKVDACIVGTDRTTRDGDVCNKIGTYLKALAAKANDVPFYVALPSTTIDWTIGDGVREVPIEERAPEEVSWMQGRNIAGDVQPFLISPADTPCANYAFDVTPAAYVTALITERGICAANAAAMAKLFGRSAN